MNGGSGLSHLSQMWASLSRVTAGGGGGMARLQFCSRQWTEVSEATWAVLGAGTLGGKVHRSLCPFPASPIFFLFPALGSVMPTLPPPTPRLPPPPQQPDLPPGTQASFQAPGPVSPPRPLSGPHQPLYGRWSLSLSQSAFLQGRGADFGFPLTSYTLHAVSLSWSCFLCESLLTGHSDSLRAGAKCSHPSPCHPGSYLQGLDEWSSDDNWLASAVLLSPRAPSYMPPLDRGENRGLEQAECLNHLPLSQDISHLILSLSHVCSGVGAPLPDPWLSPALDQLQEISEKANVMVDDGKSGRDGASPGQPQRRGEAPVMLYLNPQPTPGNVNAGDFFHLINSRQNKENWGQRGWSNRKVQAARSLVCGWGRGCREDDRHKCRRRGNQLNGKIDNMRFKGKEKTGEVLEIWVD